MGSGKDGVKPVMALSPIPRDPASSTEHWYKAIAHHAVPAMLPTLAHVVVYQLWALPSQHCQHSCEAKAMMMMSAQL